MIQTVSYQLLISKKNKKKKRNRIKITAKGRKEFFLFFFLNILELKQAEN